MLVGVHRQRVEQDLRARAGYSDPVAAVEDIEVWEPQRENGFPAWLLWLGHAFFVCEQR